MLVLPFPSNKGKHLFSLCESENFIRFPISNKDFREKKKYVAQVIIVYHQPLLQYYVKKFRYKNILLSKFLLAVFINIYERVPLLKYRSRQRIRDVSL
jgi:hypothetical protein